MKKINRLVTIIIPLFVLFYAPSSQAKETIYWLTWTQIPHYIDEGEFKGKGIADTLLRWLQEELSEYNHDEYLSNTIRYERLIRATDVTTCTAWAWKQSERGEEQHRLYSKAHALARPMGIFVHRKKLHLFGKPGEVLSLETLLQNKNLRFSYLQGFPYSEKTNALLKRYENEPHTIPRSSSDVAIPLRMLTLDRHDYSTGVDGQTAIEEQMKGQKTDYIFFNIQEDTDYVRMYTHCSKSEMGKAIIEQVNRFYTKERILRFLEVIERWHGPNARYRELFIENIINGNSHPNVGERS